MLISLDIETECAVVGCQDTDCRHALDPHRNRITIMATYGNFDAKIHHNLAELSNYLNNIKHFESLTLTGFNLKWDLKVITTKRPDLMWLYDCWTDDVQIMATAYTQKVTQSFMWGYQARRKALNKEGAKHRDAKEHSLKVLAPYFLGVEPFWETNDHNNVEYVTKDAKYTYDLHKFLETALKTEGTYEFYRTKFMEWNRFLSRIERRGIGIDMELVEAMDKDAKAKAIEVKTQLDTLWADAYKAYGNLEKESIVEKYTLMCNAALAKPHKQKDTDIILKYAKLRDTALAKHSFEFNLGSPVQLKWLLKDYLQLDVTGFDHEESTGKAILQRLSAGREDVKLFLEWRRLSKLTSSFFPSYRDMQVDGRIYASFHPYRARTGRLSSSDPNLQQQPADLHKLFTAGPGRKFITKDMSAIEPRLIAYYTNDENLFNILKNGQDFHGYNTRIFSELNCEVHEVKDKYARERKLGKEVGLSLFYGAGANRLQETAQKYGFSWSLGDCKYKVEKFKQSYPGVYKFREELNRLLETDSMTNLFGRQYRIADRDDIYMTGFNTLIQGSASDMVLHSAYKAQLEYDRLGIDAHVCLLVHDEIVVDVNDSDVEQADQILTTCMTNYDLTNVHGAIKLLVEGSINDRWVK